MTAYCTELELELSLLSPRPIFPILDFREILDCKSIVWRFFWIVITRGICWYGSRQHWSNFWVWPLYKLSCDPQASCTRCDPAAIWNGDPWTHTNIMILSNLLFLFSWVNFRSVRPMFYCPWCCSLRGQPQNGASIEGAGQHPFGYPGYNRPTSICICGISSETNVEWAINKPTPWPPSAASYKP